MKGGHWFYPNVPGNCQFIDRDRLSWGFFNGIMTDLNGYQLSRQWFDFCFDNPEKIRPIHTAIYFFAIEHCNRLGWKKKFGFPTQMAMEAIGIKNWRTYNNAFTDLVDWGFIELIEKSKNQYSSCIICLCKKYNSTVESNTKSLDKALQKHAQKQVNSTVGINKQGNKGTREQGNNKPYTDEFEDFWELYDKKKGKKKAWLEWKKLNGSEIEAIFENVPIFKTHFSDEQYFPYPRKYLYNRYWEDEDFQQPKHKSNGQEKPVDKARRHLEQTERIFND